MKISYKKLWHILVERDMKKQDLTRIAGLSSASVTKLVKGQNVQTDVLLKVCKAPDVGINDIMETVEIEEDTGEAAV